MSAPGAGSNDVPQSRPGVEQVVGFFGFDLIEVLDGLAACLDDGGDHAGPPALQSPFLPPSLASRLPNTNLPDHSVGITAILSSLGPPIPSASPCSHWGFTR